jgi:hypothetical protein
VPTVKVTGIETDAFEAFVFVSPYPASGVWKSPFK